MQSAVIIPYRFTGDSSVLDWTLDGYARQVLTPGHRVEIWVGMDGGDAVSFQPKHLRAAQGDIEFHWKNYPRIGAAEVRNRLVQECGEGPELLIFGNADARPEPDMVRRHADAMTGLPKGSLVLGSAPWEKPPPEQATVFDALLAETPMVFFYNQLSAHDWYDFRHAWTLNLSVRADDFRASGGFPRALRPVYYEDLALGFRLMGARRKGVWYEPEARVIHRHPTTLEQYLDREELLGLMSPVLAKVCSEVYAAIHGNASVPVLAEEYRRWVSMDSSLHQWIYRRLKEWAALPEECLGIDESRNRVLMTIYQMHVPLKRLAFRLGFLRGLELIDDSQWELRRPAGLWKSVVAS
jgi:hypothetical protein